MRENLTDQQKISARKILFKAVKRDPAHANLAVEHYKQEIAAGMKMAEYGLGWDREWNTTTCLFEITTPTPRKKIIGWYDGSDVFNLQQKVHEDAIYRLTQAILQTDASDTSYHSEFNPEHVRLVYNFIKNKTVQRNDKLLVKIAKNAIKSKKEKLGSCINKIEIMLNKLRNTLIEQKEQESITTDFIQGQLIKTRDILLPILENLYIEENNSPQRIKARSSIARIICNIIYDQLHPFGFQFTENSYSIEEYQKMISAYNEAKLLFDEIFEEKRILFVKNETAKKALKETFNINLIISTMILLKKNPVLNQNNVRPNSEEEKNTMKVILVSNNDQEPEQEFIIPMEQLEKIPVLYKNIEQFAYQEKQQKCIKINVHDIGFSVSRQDVASFLRFLVNANTGNFTLDTIAELQFEGAKELLDYLLVTDQDLDEKIIMPAIKNISSESQDLFEQSFPLLFSNNRHIDDDQFTKPVAFTEKLLDIAKKQHGLMKI